MKKLVIFGTGDFADIVTDLAVRTGFQVNGYLIDDEYYNGNENRKNGLPIVPFSQAGESFPAGEYGAAVGMIGQDMQTAREAVFNKLKGMGYELPNIVHPSAVIGSVAMGEGNIILEGCVLGFSAGIGNANIMWPLSAINHHGRAGSFNNFSPGATTAGGAVVGSHCFLGVNCSVNNRITVSDYTLAGAGTYIAKTTEPYGVYVPERAIKLNKTSLEMKL